MTPKKVFVEETGASTSTVTCVGLSTDIIPGGVENTDPKSSIVEPDINNVVPVPVEVTILVI